MTDKAAIYIRVSTHYQIDKDSLQVQRRELVAYCDIVLGIKSYEIFEDPGYSAKNTERPAYQEMISRIRSGEFSHLVVWKIDRISRNLLDFTNLYSELRHLGVTFVSKNEQFDTSSAIGEAMLKIILVFAELERNITSERVSQVMVSRAANGQWNGGRIPYGYILNDGVFTIDPAEKEIYLYIVRSYSRGNSLLDITRDLNDKGILSKRGKAWSPTTVHKLLTNQFYVGNYVYNVHDEKNGKRNSEDKWIIIPDHHPAMISQEEYNSIQKRLSYNKRYSRKPGDTYDGKHTHIFAGLLRCGICGSNMSATSGKMRRDGVRPSVYGCKNRRDTKKTCDNTYVGDLPIGQFVFTMISNILKAQIMIKANTSPEKLSAMVLKNLPETAVDQKDVFTLLERLKSNILHESIPEEVFLPNSVAESERTILLETRKKNELALNRLQTLYLYGNEGITEADYIRERTAIIKQQESIDAKLASMIESREEDLVLEIKASLAALQIMLTEDPVFDFEKYIRMANHTVPKKFLNQILDHVIIKYGKVSEIIFKSGLSLHFTNTPGE